RCSGDFASTRHRSLSAGGDTAGGRPPRIGAAGPGSAPGEAGRRGGDGARPRRRKAPRPGALPGPDRDPPPPSPAAARRHPDGTLRLIVQGLGRFRLADVVQEAPFLRARIVRLADETAGTTLEAEALARTATGLFRKVVALSPTLPDELANAIGGAEGPGAVADLIAASLPTLPTPLRLELLETVNVAQRLQRLLVAPPKEIGGPQPRSEIPAQTPSR